ncbi:hypothetical protein GBF38_012059 [Nibea albiflora]|uniref:Uncharacterized protein n=1 Tax=Nibea albiflora TaxID=240163 RepID=A0ACB7EJ08_NIBAL|nr:hypothetical protein GBF38_012059 [Nibea albiflora]
MVGHQGYEKSPQLSSWMASVGGERANTHSVADVKSILVVGVGGQADVFAIRGHWEQRRAAGTKLTGSQTCLDNAREWPNITSQEELNMLQLQLEMWLWVQVEDWERHEKPMGETFFSPNRQRVRRDLNSRKVNTL